jgi:hypothetical protein
MDDAAMQHGRALPLELGLLCVGVAIRPHRNRRRVGQEVDAMGLVSARRQSARIRSSSSIISPSVASRDRGGGGVEPDVAAVHRTWWSS